MEADRAEYVDIVEADRAECEDIMKVDRAALVDIRDIHIDSAKPVEARVREYLEQVRDPFLVRYGDYIIKFSYADTDKSLDDRMVEYITKMAQIKYESAGEPE